MPKGKDTGASEKQFRSVRESDVGWAYAYLGRKAELASLGLYRDNLDPVTEESSALNDSSIHWRGGGSRNHAESVHACSSVLLLSVAPNILTDMINYIASLERNLPHPGS